VQTGSVFGGLRHPHAGTAGGQPETAAWEMLPEEAERLDNLSKPAPVYPYDFQAHYPAE